jgi:hypothetical protein
MSRHSIMDYVVSANMQTVCSLVERLLVDGLLANGMLRRRVCSLFQRLLQSKNDTILDVGLIC